jgi:hypothetical protein
MNWTKAVVAELKILCRDFPGETKENHDNLKQDSSCLRLNSNPALTERRLETISWTDCVNNEAVLHRVKEQRNILHTIRRRKANWIGHILRSKTHH